MAGKATEAQRRWIERRPPASWIEERRDSLANAEVSIVEYDGRPYRLLRLPPVAPPDPLLEPRPVVGRSGYVQQLA